MPPARSGAESGGVAMLRSANAKNGFGPYAACLALGAMMMLLAPAAWSQGGFVGLAPPDAMDTVSGMSVGGGGAGNVALDRARGLQQPGMMGMPGGGPGPMPGPMFPGGMFPGDPGQAYQPPEALEPVIPTISVLVGTRVRDAVTKELLDEPVELKVPETEKGNFYDDGTHGDVMANDGKFAMVEFADDVLGEGSQRAKEQMVKALVVAEDLTPLEFYGFTIMGTDQRTPQPREKAWQMIPDPKGGPGFVLAEVETERPVEMPNYREWRNARDAKVKNDWSARFLRNYRVNPDDIRSEFYHLYIPHPPQPPEVRPPVQEGWMPFSDPQSLMRAQSGEFNTGTTGGGYGTPGITGGYPLGQGSGVTGQPIGNASSRYF
mgnify:FL=1